MRKSKRLKDLELKVTQMEMTLELLILSVNNLMESQEMVIENAGTLNALESRLDSGKWYPSLKETP
jgi:uncharacterized coiled-coil protein SlyX